MIERADLDGITEILLMKPHLANEPITADDNNPATAYPLHRICDGVFARKYPDLDGAAMARVFLKHGALVNGKEIKEKADTPLIAAASLRADEVALLLIESGAAINHKGTHGGNRPSLGCVVRKGPRGEEVTGNQSGNRRALHRFQGHTTNVGHSRV